MKNIGTINAGGSLTFTVQQYHTYLLQVGLPYNGANFLAIICAQYTDCEITVLNNKYNQFTIIANGFDITISKNTASQYNVGCAIYDITVSRP